MTVTPRPGVEIDILGTSVGFLRRDIRQINDDERGHVEELVRRHQREAGPGRSVTRIVIETDYPDPDRLSCVVSHRVTVEGQEP